MKIITILPNGVKDTIARLIMDGIQNTENIDLIKFDYSDKKYSEEEIKEHSKTADYIFVFWCKYQYRYVDKSYTHNLLDKINCIDKVVYIDGSEYNSTGHSNPSNQGVLAKQDTSLLRGEPWIDEEMYKRCKWYFKRETYEEDLQRNIIPLLVGAESSYFESEKKWWDSKKQYDVFCSFGHTSTGLRQETQDICSKLKSEGYNIIIGSGFPYQKYIDYIIQSHIGISAWGAGNSCRRMWEMLSNKTCCFVQKKEILFPNKFEDGISYVEYSTQKEFEEKLRYYLDNKDKCIEIGKRGYEHIKKYHTGSKRLEYMIEVMNGNDWRTALK